PLGGRDRSFLRLQPWHVSALAAAVVMQEHSMLFGILAGLGAGLAIGWING
ncbi:hypothetical protein A33O_13875, partial [Nitratireductor aquibiodomus RA22]